MITQDVENALKRLRHAIDHVPVSTLPDADVRTASAVAQVRIRELEAQVIAERARADGAEREAAEWEGLAERRRDELSGILTDLGALSADNARLLSLVGTETPIAAFDLATTWQAERQGYMEQVSKANHVLADMVNQYMSAREGYITHEFMSAQEDAIEYLGDIGWLHAGELERYYWTDVATAATADDVLPVFYGYIRKINELRSAAQAVLESAMRDDNNMTPDTAAALRALERCVSSNNARIEPAQKEETRTRTQECIRLIEEAQTLMRPQGEWETHVAAVKQAATDACQSVYEEWRAGAVFENMPLAIASRMALAWMDLEPPVALGKEASDV